MSQTYTIMRRILVLSLALLVALGLSWTTSVSAKDNNTPGSIAVPVVGTVSSGASSSGQAASSGKFQGTATITQFAGSGGTLVALGTIGGVVTDGTNNVVQSVAANFSAPVSTAAAPATVPAPSASSSTAPATQPAVTVAATSSCAVLNLQLGPIHLNLVGSSLDTNQIAMNLTSAPGAGSVLGNLVCNASNLMNNSGNGNVSAVVSLLNQILAAL